MAAAKLTQQEADMMISMLKRTLEKVVLFPERGKKASFQVEGTTKRDNFTIDIFRGTVNRLKCYIGARITVSGVMLMELHINPTSRHRNPDGTVIIGSHWHIYSEEYGRSFAEKAEDLQSNQFIENTLLLLKRFNVIERPDIHMQTELI
ncbi:hypothetical protein IJT93_10365 [bacterium]|nr:hypothetical protein [bacterium]